MRGDELSAATWREYQEEAAQFFRDLGYSAEVDAAVKGVRAIHRIDVWVVFEHFGLQHKWAIECKNWKAPVPKEKVLALRSIMDDVGADRGILVAESGFQPGAFDAATTTSITLTTLVDLRSRAKADVLAMRLERISRRAAAASDTYFDLYVRTQLGPSSWTMSPRPGVDLKRHPEVGSFLTCISASLDRVRMGKFPVIVGVEGERPELAADLESFVSAAEKQLAIAEPWLREQTFAVLGKEGETDGPTR